MSLNGCSGKLCPMQVGAADSCTLKKEECPYFTEDMSYQKVQEALKQIKTWVASEILAEIEEDLNNLIKYYKEKRKYVTEVDYNELEQLCCDIKIRTFEERLLKIAELKKKYTGG